MVMLSRNALCNFRIQCVAYLTLSFLTNTKYSFSVLVSVIRVIYVLSKELQKFIHLILWFIQVLPSSTFELLHKNVTDILYS